MELKDTRIYPFIKDRATSFETFRFPAGMTIATKRVAKDAIWYLVEGTVEAFAKTYNDQKIHVEFIYEDDFVGELSLYWNTTIHADFVAVTPCRLLRIPKEEFTSMLEADDKLKLFFQECCLYRIYAMYKDTLTAKIFSQQQLFAAEIVSKSNKGFFFLDFEDTCYNVNASKRNLYNLIKTFEADGLISFKRNKTIFILDEEGLEAIARPVLDFRSNVG